jgi:nucleoside-diphosphate-sugar epimerase
MSVAPLTRRTDRRVLVTGGSGFIGTHLVERLRRSRSVKLINLDVAQPKMQEHFEFWRECDILCAGCLNRIFSEFRPDQVVHLAARADLDGKKIEDYLANSQGTENIARAITATSSVSRAIFVSTQLVVAPGAPPAHDQDFRPYSIYGESKVLSEKAVREAGLDCTWTIVRPTNVWGGWSPPYNRKFWLTLKRGLYIHPGSRPVRRSFGYVGNVVSQFERILDSPRELVHEKVFYVGGDVIDQLDWINAMAVELTGEQVRVAPLFLLRFLAAIGDAVIAFGGTFPLFSARLQRMRENYITPMAATFAALGRPEISLREGAKETASWLETLDEFRTSRPAGLRELVSYCLGKSNRT